MYTLAHRKLISSSISNENFIFKEKSNMKKNLRNVLIASSVITLGALLAACGSSSTTNTSEEAQANTTNSNSGLTVAIWDNGQKPGLTEITKEFTAKTGIPVDIQVIDWQAYWTLLEAGASGGDLPDVFWMHSNEAVKYMENDILLDLTDKVKSSTVLEMDKFPQELKDMYTNDGKIYAVPKDRDSIALWYNKTMFDEAGIAYPDETWTWDDYYDAALKLTKADGSQFGTAMNPSNNQDGWYNIVYSMGGEIITEDKKKSGLDEEASLKALDFVDKLQKNTMPSPEVMSETGTDVLFTSGKIAMLPQGSWMLAPFKENEYLVENADIAVLPKDATTGKRISLYNGLGWAASANTKNPDGAFKLIEWFGSKDMQIKQAELGVTMAAYEGVSDAWAKSTDKFNLDAYLTMLNGDVVFRPASRATVVWENSNNDELKKAWSGEVTMEEAAKSAAAKMNEFISEE